MMSNFVLFLFLSYYLTQKKTLEINPRHPLIKELLRRVEANPEDQVSKGMAMMMFQTGIVTFSKLFSQKVFSNLIIQIYF